MWCVEMIVRGVGEYGLGACVLTKRRWLMSGDNEALVHLSRDACGASNKRDELVWSHGIFPGTTGPVLLPPERLRKVEALNDVGRIYYVSNQQGIVIYRASSILLTLR